MTPGHENVVREIDGHRLGVAICKDMHFASLGRSYGKEHVAAILEPAWDFNRDGWMAARIAALRGVENGATRRIGSNLSGPIFGRAFYRLSGTARCCGY